MPRLLRAAGLCSLALLVPVGCSSSSKPREPATPEEEAILHIGAAYRDASHVLHRGPKNVKELKPYLKKYGEPDALLVSPNDGQPYHIVWGLVPSQRTKRAEAQRFLAYEQTGKNGKRYALDCMLRVHHLTDADFARLQGSD